MNSSEIKKIKHACSIIDKILFQLVKELRKKTLKTEKEIYDFIIKKIKENNCKFAFKPIVAIGKNAAEIHHKASDTEIKKGFLVIDFGAKYKSYCSDCTRTFYIGKPSRKEIKIYNLIKDAQLTAINHVKAGVYAADIDLIARAYLWKYYKNFKHSTGHGVGKKIHQAPNLRLSGKFKLKENDVVTVEPGLYFKNMFGIRIEDIILVKNRPVILTRFSKKLIVI